MVYKNNILHTPIIEPDISNIIHNTLIGGVMQVTYARPISPRNYSQATAGVKYSSAKMIFLKRCAASSLSNISQSPYTNPSIYS